MVTLEEATLFKKQTVNQKKIGQKKAKKRGTPVQEGTRFWGKNDTDGPNFFL